MGFILWVNSRIKNLVWSDIQFIKLSVAAFTLMIAKLWPSVLSLNWGWYALVFILTAIKPLKSALSK
jgi:hypothetical protein